MDRFIREKNLVLEIQKVKVSIHKFNVTPTYESP
jgi:hypothetical protein